MISNELRANVSKFVQENRDNVVNDIKEIVAVKSVKGPSECDAPYGIGPKNALDKALEMAQKLGLETKNCDNHLGYAYVSGKSDKYLASIGHLDVVPEGNGWKADPFIVREIEGWLIGRGVADNKGACVLSMYMLKYFKENYGELPYSMRAIFGCDEESGMEDVKYYLETETAPAFAFTPDANFPVCCGEKGIVSFDLISKEIKDRNVIDFTAGIASNVVPDKAFMTVKLNGKTLPECADIELVIEDDIAKLTANGIGGHAAMPNGTKNAIGILVKYALENSLLNNDEKPYFEMLMNLHSVTDGSGLKIDSDDGLFDPLTCIGGMIKIEDDKFIQNLNIRYPTSTSDVKINTILNDTLVAIGGTCPAVVGRAPFYVDPKTPVITALADTYNEVTNQNTVPYTIGGGTYARNFPLAVAFGIEPLGEFLPSFVGPAHGAEEGFTIDGFMQALEIMIIAMDKLLKLEY